MAERAAITGALSLYLNFINLFTLLLQLLGQRDYRKHSADLRAPALRPGLFSSFSLVGLLRYRLFEAEGDQ